MFEIGSESPSCAIEKVPRDVLTLLFGSYRLIRWILPLFPTVDASRAAIFMSREAEAPSRLRAFLRSQLGTGHPKTSPPLGVCDRVGFTGWIRIKPAFWADGEIFLAGDRPERENGKEIRAFPASQA